MRSLRTQAERLAQGRLYLGGVGGKHFAFFHRTACRLQSNAREAGNDMDVEMEDDLTAGLLVELMH